MYCTGGTECTECLSRTPASHSVCANRTPVDMERYHIQNNKHQLLHAWKISSYYVNVRNFAYGIISLSRPLCLFSSEADISIHQNFFLHNFSCASNSLWLVCYWGKEGVFGNHQLVYLVELSLQRLETWLHPQLPFADAHEHTLRLDKLW